MGHGRDAGTRSTSDGGPGVPADGPISVRVPAKINLFLSVRSRRADGYHDLVSVMQTIGLYDAVTVEMNGTASLCHHPSARRLMDIELAPHADLPSGRDNLAVQAAHHLLDVLGASSSGEVDSDHRPRTVLRIRKSIPIGAGMAGGSADAAATLVALDRLWACDLDRDELREVASDLGADVPFCLQGGTALATGTGTVTAQVLSRGRYHWVVGISDEPLSTAEVYARWDAIGRPSEVEPDAVLHALRTGDAEALGAALHNDLQVAAVDLRPRLRDDLEAMMSAGALGAVVSGSGPTVLGLAADLAGAQALAATVASRFDRVEVAASPAGGPELG